MTAVKGNTDMKRIIAVLLTLLLLCSCAHKREVQQTTEQKENFVGIWITYTELAAAAKGDFKTEFSKMAENCSSLGATALFVHVRAMSDSIYTSAYFPLVSWAEDLDFDVLAFMIEECHSRGIEFHAWINPYRISSSKSKLDQLPEDSPAHSLSSCIGQTEKGLYFDPSKAPARKLVIDGVREILSHYGVDGIHFDDYFYPTDSTAFDLSSYSAYCAETEKPLALADWRRVNVNLLIEGVCSAVRSSGTTAVFTVSPAANIENNENSLYADVDYWCKSGYLDAVIPQLYFGFSYPNEQFCFERLLNDWIDYTGDSTVKLYIGLAPYKLDTDSAADKTEWAGGTNIVARQLELIKNNPAADGAVLFSYSYLFSENENIIKQKENIKKVIN